MMTAPVSRDCRKQGPFTYARSLATTTVGIDHVYAHNFAGCQGRHDGAQGLGGASGTPDHAAEVIGVNPNLEDLPAASFA